MAPNIPNGSTTSSDIPSRSRWSQSLAFIKKHSNFYRVHLTSFTIVPFVFGAIMYASNGQYPVSFLDCLFLCYSAMSNTGLGTVNLSTVTVWQQVILFFMMLLGHIVSFSFGLDGKFLTIPRQ